MKILAFLFAFLPALAFAQTITRDGITLTQTQETRAESIGDQLRCLVCQNESVEGSSATLAKQLRVIIRQHVIAGDSAKDIMDFMVHRYGIFVLLKPPVMPLTFLLYATPALALMFGLGIFWFSRRTKIVPPPPLSASDAKRLRDLL